MFLDLACGSPLLCCFIGRYKERYCQSQTHVSISDPLVALAQVLSICQWQRQDFSAPPPGLVGRQAQETAGIGNEHTEAAGFHEAHRFESLVRGIPLYKNQETA